MEIESKKFWWNGYHSNVAPKLIEVCSLQCRPSACFLNYSNKKMINRQKLRSLVTIKKYRAWPKAKPRFRQKISVYVSQMAREIQRHVKRVPWWDEKPTNHSITLKIQKEQSSAIEERNDIPKTLKIANKSLTLVAMGFYTIAIQNIFCDYYPGETPVSIEKTTGQYCIGKTLLMGAKNKFKPL